MVPTPAMLQFAVKAHSGLGNWEPAVALVKQALAESKQQGVVAAVAAPAAVAVDRQRVWLHATKLCC